MNEEKLNVVFLPSLTYVMVGLVHICTVSGLGDGCTLKGGFDSYLIIMAKQLSVVDDKDCIHLPRGYRLSRGGLVGRF